MHNLRVGGHMEIPVYDLTSDFTSMGNYTFNSINDFLIVDRARTFDAVQPGSDATRNLRQTVFGFFVQDDLQLRRDLTVNAGVRYEPTTDITEADGKLAQLIDFASSTATAERHDGGRRCSRTRRSRRSRRAPASRGISPARARWCCAAAPACSTIW